MSDLIQRTASLRDLKEIWDLFRNTAAAVPFDVEQDADQEGLLTEIMACCTYGVAPIAVGKDKAVLGALLVRRDTFQWALFNGEALHIAYAAVAPEQAETDLLEKLIAAVQSRNVPVLASVKSGNQGGFAAALTKLGFVKEATAENGWGELYQWQPAPAATVH